MRNSVIIASTLYILAGLVLLPDVCINAGLYGINLCLTVVILRRAIPDTLPLLVPEAADATVDFQIDAIIAALARMRGA